MSSTGKIVAAVKAVLLLACLGDGSGAGPARAQSVAGLLAPPKAAAPAASKTGTGAGGAPIPAEPKPQDLAIPLPEIVLRAGELRHTLRGLAGALPADDRLGQMEAEIQLWDAEPEARREQVEELLRSAPSSIEIRELKNYWQNLRIEAALRARQASGWAEAAQKALNQLEVLRLKWSATLEANRNDPNLKAILEIVEDALREIEGRRTQTRDKLLRLVGLQIATTRQDQFVADVVARLSAEQVAKGVLLHRDSLPLWQVASRRAQGDSRGVFSWTKTRWAGVLAFGSDYRHALMLLAGLLATTLWLTRKLARATAGARPADARQTLALLIVHRWFSLGLLPPLLFSCLLLPEAPTPLIGALILVWCVPILRLLPPQDPISRTTLHCAVGIYAAYALATLLTSSPTHNRDMTFVVSCLTVLVFGYLVRPSRIRAEWAAHRRRVTEILLVMVALGISAAANLFGYMRLSQLIRVSFVYGSFIAIGVYTTMRTFALLLTVAVDTRQAARLAVVREHRKAVLKWFPRALYGGGFLLWFAATLELMGIRDEVGSGIRQVLALPLGPSSSVTVGLVCSVVLILVGGYLFAAAIRFTLREDILSRLDLARGIPELIASSIFYVLLLIFILSAASAGAIEWSKLTLFTGAIGVGVGFGLQNIISNFMSGLILKFERPINNGDVVEIDGQTGLVTRIGVRSSTIRTFQGAEVVVPNANFISNKVINWTLTDPERRLELPVGVAYGTGPDRVIELLHKAATSHQNVLPQPAPVAYFHGFGDSSLNFELWFWILRTSNGAQVKSEIGLTIMRLFEEAGIEIPFPQRDLRIRHSEVPGVLPLARDAADCRP